jgi:sugar diacid utilization regulator
MGPRYVSATQIKSNDVAPRLEPRDDHSTVDSRALQAEMVADVIAGKTLARVAQLAATAAGGPVTIVVPRLATAVSSSDTHASSVIHALREWVADRARGRPAVVPRSVSVMVPIRFREQVAGIVALLHDTRPPLPQAMACLEAAAVATLMELAIQEAREETEQRVRGSFLEDVRLREQLSGIEISRRAARLGCDLSRGAMVLCSTVTDDSSHLVVATIAAEHPGAIAEQLGGTVGDPRPRVYAVLPSAVGDGSVAATQASARQLAEGLRQHAIVGLSSFHADPAALGEAIREAELMLDVLRHSREPITEEVGGGTYQLLFRMLASHPDEVRAFYESTIAALARYDDRNNTELIRTLQAYFDANCNMNATAVAIFAHRHTIADRLERIRKLTNLDPMLSEHRERLGLGLKIHRIAPSSTAVLNA